MEPVQGQTITTSDLRVSVSHSSGDLGSISLDTDPVYIIPTCAGEALRFCLTLVTIFVLHTQDPERQVTLRSGL